ncbi:hypothetical protein ACH4UX_23795 [Streptomyces althioticus]|jgi:hypothetical protein|uniref:Uncharacterized protein n=1 Tax=Streptomyces griseorubens TaxID=66897 RepID=A0ABR4T7P1_9ACTN|nr:hypothetical protein [Streptomyces griseorubens]ALV49025.1 hypothetical protein ASR50_06195 [Streptomyces sp. 4F]MCC9684893.1 hypothetical protein [Streptomyces sp. MNU103]WTC26420.1 hypothetical protein OG872_28700 [Streptomyces althioticus]KEG43462.1 hypothetical protein DJ64_24805 [Streptomyces griseorubens]GGQ74336.1 hypothetical protein GCM10010250_52800 [Streptomyces althioticus]
MTEPIAGWIWGRNLHAFLLLLSHYAGYDFDDTDWGTVEAGVQGTDDEASDRWYSYPLVGTSATLSVALARAVCGEEVSVSVTGAETLELRLRTDTLLSAFARI